MNIKNKIKPIYWDLKDFFTVKKEIKKEKFTYINWWGGPNAMTDWEWLEKFIEYHFQNKINKNIRLYSVFGPVKNVKEKTQDIKIFYSPENLEPYVKYKLLKEKNEGVKPLLDRIYDKYKDYALPYMDLSMGYVSMKHERYLRFPVWIKILFKPNSEYSDIVKRVNEINNMKSNAIFNKAILINRHDMFGTRTKICDDISSILDIDYAGQWRNNTNLLWSQYKNNKIEMMKQYKFSICPENVDAPQFLTERLFTAFEVGAIPLYHGALNNPEPDIICKDSIIFWDYCGDNYENIKLIKRLKTDDNYFRKFIAQPKLSKDTADFVYNKMQELKRRLSKIIN